MYDAEQVCKTIFLNNSNIVFLGKNLIINFHFIYNPGCMEYPQNFCDVQTGRISTLDG